MKSNWNILAVEAAVGFFLLLLVGCQTAKVAALAPPLSTAPPALPVSSFSHVQQQSIAPAPPRFINVSWTNPVLFSNEYTVLQATTNILIPRNLWPVILDVPAESSFVAEIEATGSQEYIEAKNQDGP
jgi:hypothetical protein